MRRSVLVSLVACFLLPSAFAQQPMVRVVHASPDAPAVDVLVNDSIRAFQDIEFGDVTDYAPLDADLYNVKVVPEGAGPESAVIDADLNLLWFQRYTVVAINTLNAIEPLVIEDSPALMLPGRARFRFVHASPDAPAVDIRVQSGPFLFQNVAFRQVGEYVEIPETMVNLEVYVAGTDTLVLTVPAVSLDAGTSYTAYAVGFAGGQAPELSAILSVDRGLPLPVVINGGGPGRGASVKEPAPPAPVVINDDDLSDRLGRFTRRFR